MRATGYNAAMRGASVATLVAGLTLPLALQAQRTPVARFVAEVTHTVGGSTTSDSLTLGRVDGMARAGSGEIAIADGMNHQIILVTPTGAIAGRFGRRGSGPNEFIEPCCLAFDMEGRLWVRDGGNGRLALYRVSGDNPALVHTFRQVHGSGRAIVPVTTTRGGVVDIGDVQDAQSGALQQFRFHMDTTGRVTRRELIPPAPPESIGVRAVTSGGGQRSVAYVRQPFGPRLLVAHGHDGRWARVVSSSHDVFWYDPPTGQAYRLSRYAHGPALSSDERRRAQQSLADDVRRLRLGSHPYSVPDRKPPIRSIFFDQTGRLWVEESVPEGAMRAAAVFGTGGVVVARVEWPSDVDISFGAIDATGGVGIHRDADGVERAVLLRFTERSQ